jgi:hypothetical protein
LAASIEGGGFPGSTGEEGLAGSAVVGGFTAGVAAGAGVVVGTAGAGLGARTSQPARANTAVAVSHLPSFKFQVSSFKFRDLGCNFKLQT